MGERRDGRRPFLFCPRGRQREQGVGLIFLNLSPKTVNAFIDVIDVEFAILSGQSDSEGGPLLHSNTLNCKIDHVLVFFNS